VADWTDESCDVVPVGAADDRQLNRFAVVGPELGNAMARVDGAHPHVGIAADPTRKALIDLVVVLLAAAGPLHQQRQDRSRAEPRLLHGGAQHGVVVGRIVDRDRDPGGT